MNYIADRIGYTGVLEIELSSPSNNARYKNSGTSDLFTSLCRFLSGTITEKLPIPAFIDVMNNDQSLLVSPAPITSAQVVSGTGGSSSVVYLSSINKFNVKMSSMIRDIKIKMLDKSMTHVLAEIVLGEEDAASFSDMLASLQPGINMALKWSLTFSNSSQSVSLDELQQEVE